MSASAFPTVPAEAMDQSVRASAGTSGGWLPVVSATPADYPAIHHFLAAVFQGPSPREFKASLEDPFSKPHDRLLVRRGTRIMAHVHLTRRVMQFGRLQIPAAGVAWLGSLPEFRGRGFGGRLLAAAEKEMASDGALVGLLRTKIPYFFRRTGWALCGRNSRSQAGARAVISELLTQGLLRRYHRRRRRLNIRPWRRVELAALVRIYNQNLAGTFGPFQRTEAYWRWLIRRRAYDQIYVALDGPDLLELEEINAPIVGYAVTQGERIVELLTAPDCRAAAAQLLGRACGDAIERDCHRVTLEALPGHRLHRLFQQGGGRKHHHEPDRGEVLMAKLLDPVGLLLRLSAELHDRSQVAGLPTPIELGLLIDGKKYRLMIRREEVKVARGKVGRSYLRLNVADFTRLLLGHLDWQQALSSGRLEASTGLALEAGRALFPRLPLWRPPLDDLLS